MVTFDLSDIRSFNMITKAKAQSKKIIKKRKLPDFGFNVEKNLVGTEKTEGFITKEFHILPYG